MYLFNPEFLFLSDVKDPMKDQMKKTDSAKILLEHSETKEHKLGIVMGAAGYTKKPGIFFFSFHFSNLFFSVILQFCSVSEF